MKKRIIKSFISAMLVISMVPPLSSCQAKVPDVVREPALELMKSVYEVEEAELVNAAVSTELDDYTGEGCVRELTAGASLTFSVDVPVSAEYAIELRYANGTGESKSLSVSVNGAESSAELSVTPNATTWVEKLLTYPLNAGVNSITFSCNDGANAGVSIDRIGVCRVYQAENGVLEGGAASRRAYSGYSGEGYVPLSAKENGVSLKVDAPVTGSYELAVYYSSHHTNSDGRSVTFSVNGDNGEQLWLNPTRDNNIWGVYRHTVSLQAGENTLTFRYGNNDNGEFNLDCVTLKPSDWEYAGRIESVEGSGTSRLDVKLDNCYVRIDSVAKNTVRVWLDQQGLFNRKYESAAVVNESVAPQKLNVKETGKYYHFKTGDITVRLYKDPFRIVYLDGDEVVMMNDAYSLGWTSDGELICRNVIGENEHFWGLGETPLSFDRLGTKSAFWGNDIVASRADSAVPATTKDGRWYMNNPVFSSSKGYTVLFDNPSRTVFDFGVDDPETYYFASLNPYPAGELIYYFIYGPSIKEEMTGLSKIIGSSFFAPLWGYGNTQSHWGYTQADIERVSQEYRDKEIPLDLIIADIEWYQYFCTPTEWNSQNFPDPDRMKALLDELNIRFGVIDDPNITAISGDYAEGDKYNYFVKGQDGKTLNVSWPWGDQSGLTDFFDPEAREWWKSLHEMIMEYGVDFFWMDMNEPAKYNANWYFYNEENKAFGTLADCKNIFAQMQQRTMYELMTEDNSRSLMLTRSGYTGTQRYAAPWTGDIDSDYKAIKQQLSLGLGLSMSGYMYWTFDIGGSAGGHSDNEFKRWIELGTFMPLTRYHSTAKLEQKEPYTHGAESIAKNYISLRYQLMPYFYSLSADSIIGIGIESEKGGSGLPLVRPMLMEFENDEETWGMDTQFMSGQSFLVAPVLDVLSYKRVYLPEGYTWYDYNNSKTIFKGEGDYIKYDAPIDILPAFVKEGSIIPMHDVVQYVGEKDVSTIYLDIFPTLKDGEYSFVYYEDDGETLDYNKGEYATTRYEGKSDHKLFSDKAVHTVTVEKREGSYTDIAERDYILQFHILESEFLSAEVNGKEVTDVNSVDALSSVSEGCYFDKPSGIVYVKTHDTAEEINVSVTVKE